MEAKVKKEMRTFSAKVAFIHWTHQNLVRIFGMFAFNVYICSIILIETLMSTQMMHQTIADYFKTQPVVKAWLFGSYSRGEQRPWSDVDILVQYDRSHLIGLMKIASMKVDLEDLLNCEVDLVEEGTLRPWAVENVNRDKKLIYERA